MTRNVGGIDRVLRILVGLALLAWALVGAPASAWSAIGWLGIVPLATGLVAGARPMCPSASRPAERLDRRTGGAIA